VSEVLGRVARRIGGPSPDVVAALFSRWEALVGTQIADHCRPVSVRNGVLDVVVDQPAWASQIRYMSTEILAVVANTTASTEVTQIRVRVSGDPASPRRSRRNDP
jgi:predicted nucleic acid-binding Zn ribbon protein